MSNQHRTWTHERTAPVRADADGLFIPRSDLPDASVGDQVVVASAQNDQRRVGTIAEAVDDDRSPAWRVELDSDTADSSDVAQDHSESPRSSGREDQKQRRRFDFASSPGRSGLARKLRRGGMQAYVEVDDETITVRFGPWLVRSPLANVRAVEVTGPYHWWKVLGPHWSLADHGLTFGTNARAGVCLRFHEPISGGDPFGRMRHPGLTVTVERPDEFADLVRDRIACR
jgi:hypothetical protein